MNINFKNKLNIKLTSKMFNYQLKSPKSKDSFDLRGLISSQSYRRF